MALFTELRRRNVFKVLAVYLIGSWLIIKLLHHLHPLFGLPHWIEKLVGLILLIGLPLAMYFAWIYEITPVGLKKAVDVDQTQSIVYKTGQKLNAALAVVTVLLLASVVVGRLFPEPPALIDDSPVMVAPTMQGVPPEIRSVTLENGLEIIVWPDHDIPNVALYYFVRAGGRNEYPGITGLSHFFEHMMFNGTEDLAPGEFDRIMEANGGSNNAYTTRDITVYTDWFQRTALEVMFGLESDRFARLEFVPELVESERGVVVSERRSTTDDQNQWFLAEQVQATAFVAHPYQNPVIGWPSDIESWTIEELERYHRLFLDNHLALQWSLPDAARELVGVAPRDLGDRRVDRVRDAGRLTGQYPGAGGCGLEPIPSTRGEPGVDGARAAAGLSGQGPGRRQRYRTGPDPAPRQLCAGVAG